MSFLAASKGARSAKSALAGSWLSALLISACSTETPDKTRSSTTGSGGSTAPTTPGTTMPGGDTMAPPDGTSSGTGGDTTTPPAAGTTAPPVTGSGGAPGSTGEPPAAGSADWRFMGYDHGSTYFNRAETKLTQENAASLEVAWTADLGGNVYGAPLQVGDKIYASGPSSVRAFDAATGMQLWTTPVSSTGSLAYDDGKLYINSNVSNIVALDAATGMQLWSKPQNPASRSDGTSSVLVAGDLIVVGGSNGGIELLGGRFRGFMSALDRITGDVKWTTYTVPETANGAAIWSSPAADPAAGRIYGTTGNNYGSPATDTSDAFIAFNMETGAIEWKNQRVMNDTFGGGARNGPDADFGANPVVYETMVEGVMTKLISSGNKGGEAHAVRADDGTMVWTRALCMGSTNGVRGIFTNSTWSGKDMLFACNNGTTSTLYALNGATGDVSWMRELPGLVWGRTAAANGVGFVGTGTNLEVFDLDTGAMIKSFPSKGGTVAGTITVANGRVAFGEGLTWGGGSRGSTLTVLALP